MVGIGELAFSDCTMLEEIVVDEMNPNYCSKDGVLYSKDMTRLIACPGAKKSIEIPDSVTMIQICAFCGCENLTSIEIPSGVIELGLHAFESCNGLTEIHFNHKCPMDFSDAFNVNSIDLSKITLYVPIASEKDYRKHPFYSEFGKIVGE